MPIERTRIGSSCTSFFISGRHRSSGRGTGSKRGSPPTTSRFSANCRLDHGGRPCGKHFLEEMPRGVRKPAAPPAIEAREDIDSVYWGGALFALAADVRIRQETNGAHSLDDVLRAALAQAGDATHEAKVDDFVRLGDAATGTHVLADLQASWAVRGEGSGPTGALAVPGRRRRAGRPGSGSAAGCPPLRDNAPLSAVRRAIGSSDGHREPMYRHSRTCPSGTSCRGSRMPAGIPRGMP